MALASRTFVNAQFINRSVVLAKQQLQGLSCVSRKTKVLHRLFSDVRSKPIGNSAADQKIRDPAVFFFKDEVQRCLLEMNMRDTSKVFIPRKEGKEIVVPEMKFLTDEELEEAKAEALQSARYYLQLPPVLLPKEELAEILSDDPALQGLEESRILFTDISYGLENRERLIVVREPNGILRKANREERHRMIQTYFPERARSLETPSLFLAPNLKSLLERSEFVYVLDRACAQFEPDDEEYVAVTSTTYDFIDENQKYDTLVGTRHYGSMAFYLAFHGRHDKFLKHCISTYRIEDAVALVKVFYITRPDLKDFKQPLSPDDTNFLKEYISMHANDKAILSMTLNAYLEVGIPSAAEEARMKGDIP